MKSWVLILTWIFALSGTFEVKAQGDIQRVIRRQVKKDGQVLPQKPVVLELRYDREGRELRKVSYYGKGLKGRIERGYSWRGDTLITNRKEFGPEGVADSTISVAFFEAGKRQSEAVFRYGPKRIPVEGRLYYYDGEKLQKVVIREYDGEDWMQYQMDHSYEKGRLVSVQRYRFDAAQNVIMDYSLAYRYDAQGRRYWQQRTDHARDGRGFVSTTVRKYDEQGREISQVYSENGKEMTRTEFVFDAEDRVIQEHVYRKGKLEDSFLMEYDFF